MPPKLETTSEKSRRTAADAAAPITAAEAQAQDNVRAATARRLRAIFFYHDPDNNCDYHAFVQCPALGFKL